jgi:hypothetical protein
MPRTVGLLLMALAVPVLLSGAQSATGVAALRTVQGEVVADDAAATPLRRVPVAVSGKNIVSDPVYTDARGRFAVAVPAAASYSLSSRKRGSRRTRSHRLPRVSLSCFRSTSRCSLASRYIRIIRAGAALPDDPRPVDAAAFRVSSVPPGDYWIVAVDRFDSAERQDADVMEMLTVFAERITGQGTRASRPRSPAGPAAVSRPQQTRGFSEVQ